MIKRVLRKVRKYFILERERRKGEYKEFNHYASSKVGNKNVVIITHDAAYGGVPLVSLNITKHLMNCGYSVDNVIFRIGKLAKEFYELAPCQFCYTKNEFIEILERLVDSGFTNVICNGTPSGKYIDILKEKNVKIVSMIHELPGAIRTLDINSIAKKMASESDEIIFPSKFVRDKFENEICKISVPVRVFHQGIYNTPNTIINKYEAKKEVSRKFQIDPNRNLYINVATINERKGFDIFVKTAQLDPESNYLWIGDGMDSMYGKRIKREYKEFPPNLYLPGYISNTEFLHLIYAAADAFFLTSREEPFGSVVLESFANGTPVIGFRDCGGFNDVVHDGKTGFLCNLNNTREIIYALRNINANENEYAKMSQNCYEYAINSGFEQYCKKIMESFEE